jgi:hypothetical protein
MPNAAPECNSQRTAIAITEMADISHNLAKSARNGG